MARGWESKSIESQVQDQQTASPKKRGKKSNEEVERDHKRHSLEMSRRRVVSELKTTQSQLRKTSLEAALQFLDTELNKLDAQNSR